LFFSSEKDAKKPGTIGRTQGEKKDNTPNPNEIKILSSIYQFKQMWKQSLKLTFYLKFVFLLNFVQIIQFSKL